jgi:hypothetical protein
MCGVRMICLLFACQGYSLLDVMEDASMNAAIANVSIEETGSGTILRFSRLLNEAGRGLAAIPTEVSTIGPLWYYER